MTAANRSIFQVKALAVALTKQLQRTSSTISSNVSPHVLQKLKIVADMFDAQRWISLSKHLMHIK
jgi:hypothetical protein